MGRSAARCQCGPPSVDVRVDFRQDGIDDRGLYDITSQRGVTVLRYTSQISRQHEVLREGPSGVIDVRYGALGSHGKIKAAIAEIGQFIEDSDPFIREQLQAALHLVSLPEFENVYPG